LKVFSLFSGIGGFDLAFKNQGHHIVGACEIDKYARQVYGKHFPDVPIHEDATKLNPEELPDFDILCAGFPCQSFSTAGKRLGFEESRGTLFYEIARIARQKRPRYIFLENVRGLLYHDEGRTFTTIIKTFYELGYDIEWQVINSKYFVPQNRSRVFIIGYLRGTGKPKVFPIRETQEKLIIPNQTPAKNLPDLIAQYSKRPTDGSYLIYLSQTNMNMKQKIQKRDNTWTLTNARDFGIFVNGRIRLFTPLECERLQGFPDNWTEGLLDRQRYKQIGNAVTVPLVEYIISKLVL